MSATNQGALDQTQKARVLLLAAVAHDGDLAGSLDAEFDCHFQREIKLNGMVLKRPGESLSGSTRAKKKVGEVSPRNSLRVGVEINNYNELVADDPLFS